MGAKKTRIKNKKNNKSYANKNNKKKRKINKFKLFTLFCLFSIVFVSFFSVYNSFSSANNIEETKIKETKSDEIENTNLNKTKVFIDASFGGLDNGYITKNGIKAKDITLSIANKINDELAKYDDVEVIMSRTEDINLTCNERVELINNSNSKLAVSIRVNGQSEDFTANGLQCYFNYKNELYKDSFNLADVVQDMTVKYVPTKKRYLVGTSFDILEKSKIPSIIVLAGFLTTPFEEKNLTNEEYQNQLAIGIAQGILNYVDNDLKKD